MNEQPVYDWTGVVDESEDDPVETVPVEDEALTHLATGADLLEDHVKAFAHAASNNRLGRYLYELQELRKRLQRYEGELETAISEAMGRQKVYAIPGGLVVAKSRYRKRTWLIDDLLSKVTRTAWVDRRTGAVPTDEEQQVVWRVRDAIANVFRLEPRATTLPAMGLDPDAFSHSEWRTSITVTQTGADEAEAND